MSRPRDIQANTPPTPVSQTPEATVSEPRNGDFPTRPVTRGHIAIGESATGSIRQRGDGDAFRVELESGITYQIDVKGDATADGTLTDPRTPGIKDADGEIIPGTSNDNSNNTLNSQILFTPTQSGSHYIVVRSAVEDHGPHSTGTYTVSIKLEGAAEEEQTDLVAADSSTRAFLGVDGEIEETIDHFADEDWFRVVLTAGTRYAITATGSPADDSLTLEIPWLFGLLDSESQPLLMHQRDDEEAESTRIQAVDGVAAGYHRAENDGTYYVSVSSRSDVGTYRISVREAPDWAHHSNGIPEGTETHFHELGPYSPWKHFNAWCPRGMEQKTVGGTPVEGGTHMTKVEGTKGWVGIMSDDSTVPINTLSRCIGVGDPYMQNGVPLRGEEGNILYSNTNRRWYLMSEYGSASNNVPRVGTLSDATPVITRPDYLRYIEEQDWSRFSVRQPGIFCVSVDRPAVAVLWNNGGDAQPIHGAARVYRERVSKSPMSLDFANDPDGAKAAWLANSEIVRVESRPDSYPRAFFSDGTELPLKDTWYLYDGTIDGDDYGGFVSDRRNVVSYGGRNARAMADRLFESQRYIQIDGGGPREFFTVVTHGGTGFTGHGEYNLTIGFGKCQPHSDLENGNARSNPPPPRNLRAVQEKGAVQLDWEPPDDAEVTGYRIERRPTGGNQSDEQGSAEPRTDDHTLVEDTGSADTGYTDKNLETDVEYQYRVSARNQDAAGEASGWVNAAPDEESMTSKDAAAWSATMTVEWVHQGYGYYSTDTKKAGSLSPASFQVDGTTYTVRMVETQGWWMYIGLDRELPFDFVLELDGTRFASNDASFSSYSYANIYRWEGTGLSLRDGDTVEVRLLRAFEDETAVNSPATGQSTISGTVQVGETLTADTSGIADPDGLDDAVFNYQWLADDTEIQGATNADYTLAEADEGKAVKVQVSFTDDVGNPESLTSAATDAVAAATPENNPATGAPSINGTAQVGETLTADTSGISDADGLTSVSYIYQWIRNDGNSDSEISGATASTHTLADVDQGKTVKVQVSFTDDGGNEETLTSTETATVEATPNNPATGAPTISGTAQVGETLTADTSDIADVDGLNNAAFSYQWLADDTEVAGATGSTHTLVEADQGKAVKVRVSFTDDGGNDETLASTATDAVAAPEPPAKPTGLSATASHDEVTLTWDDPNDDTITGYVILRRNRDTDAEGEFTNLVEDTGSAATTYTDDTVAAETPYTYRIKAINEHGTSERSRWVHVETTAAPALEGTPEQSVSEGDTDLPNDNSTPGRVAVGGSATGAIGTPGDQDRFAVELEAGRTYRFDLTGSPGGGGTLPDTFFRAIYNSAGQYQADSYNDDFEGSRDSRVTFTPTESGTYYARVSGDRDEVPGATRCRCNRPIRM